MRKRISVAAVYDRRWLLRRGEAWPRPHRRGRLTGFTQNAHRERVAPTVSIARGKVKPFLKVYHTTMAAMADRQTYTFQEHLFHASEHKRHEQGWFLMQMRLMLWQEKGETLELQVGLPRAYLKEGKRLEIERAASYFGPFSLRVESELKRGVIRAEVESLSERRPRRMEVRLPHPEGRKARWVEGGQYEPETERVIVEPFTGKATVTLGFQLR